MTEAPSGLGAPARVEAIAVVNDYSDLSRAVLRLGEVAQLHLAEEARLRPPGWATQQEVSEAWQRATAQLVEAVQQLQAVEAGIALRRRAVFAAVSAAEDNP